MSIDYNQNAVAVPLPNYRVHTKALWTDDWTLQPHLIPLSLRTGANQQCVGQLLYQTGKVLREGAEEYVDADPVDLVGAFCMIETYSVDVDGEDDELLDRFIGVIEIDDREITGVDPEGLAVVDQTFSLYGMERLLDSRVIRGSWIMGKNPKAGSDIIACKIATPLVFNAPGWGTSIGQKNRYFEGATHLFNRTITDGKEPVYNAGNDAGFTTPYAFGMLSDDADGSDKDHTWCLADVLNYLVSYFAPALDGVGTEGAIGFRLDSLERVKGLEPATAVEKLLVAIMGDGSDPAMSEVYGFSPEGKTVFECLNELLTPARGFGWTMVYVDSGESTAIYDGEKGPIIAIFTVNETAITVGTAILPATPLQASLQVTDRQDVHYVFSKTGVHNYGRIVVQGERILSCFSVSGADGSLDKGWTSQEETEYTTPDGLTDVTDHDKIQELRARSRVWKEYVVKKDWNFKAKNGENSGSGMVVNPVCGDDGVLVETPVSLTRRDKRFEEFIPIAAELPEGATVPPEPLYMRPRVFAKWKGMATVWIDLVSNRLPEAPEARLRMLDDRFGVEIVCRPNDRLTGDGALNTTYGMMTVNWSSEMIVTVAMRTDARVSYTITTSGDPLRELIIDVPNAELWLIAEGTVFDVDSAGALKRKVSGDRIARDDRPRLKQVAAMAQAWYGTARRGAKVLFNSLTYRLPDVADPEEFQPLYVGLLVTNIKEVDESAPVNTVIWARSIDYLSNTIVYETASPAPPDFSLSKTNRRMARQQHFKHQRPEHHSHHVKRSH